MPPCYDQILVLVNVVFHDDRISVQAEGEKEMRAVMPAEGNSETEPKTE